MPDDHNPQDDVEEIPGDPTSPDDEAPDQLPYPDVEVAPGDDVTDEEVTDDE